MSSIVCSTSSGRYSAPGPDNNPGAYFDDAKSCQAHMAKVGADKSTDILTVAKAKFFTDDPVEAIYKALTLASIVVRESGLRGRSRGSWPNRRHPLPAPARLSGENQGPADGNRWQLPLPGCRPDGLVRVLLGPQTDRR